MLRRTGFAKKVYTPAPPPPLRALVRRPSYAVADVVVAVPKREYIRSPQLLAAVRTLPCMASGIVGETEAAHANWGWGKGMGMKCDDNRIAALCRTVHRKLDQGSTWTDAERRDVWWRAHVATVRELLRRGIWPANVPVPDIRSFDA